MHLLRVPHTHLHTPALTFISCACMFVDFVARSIYDHLRALRSNFNRIRIFLYPIQLLHSVSLTSARSFHMYNSQRSTAAFSYARWFQYFFLLAQSNVMWLNLKHFHPLVVDIFSLCLSKCARTHTIQ